MSDEITKLDQRELEKKATRRIRNMVGKITRKGLKQFAEGLEDRVTPFADRSVSQAFSQEVYKQVMANNREATKAVAALGVVLTQARMKDSEWERRCQEDEERRNADAIDAEVVK